MFAEMDNDQEQNWLELYRPSEEKDREQFPVKYIYSSFIILYGLFSDCIFRTRISGFICFPV
ncbi:MAG: hypothetical protein ACOC2G_04045 [Bacillota bacterium]